MAGDGASWHLEVERHHADTAPLRWKHVWALFCGMLGAGTLLAFCDIVPDCLRLHVTSNDSRVRMASHNRFFSLPLNSFQSLPRVRTMRRDMGYHHFVDHHPPHQAVWGILQRGRSTIMHAASQDQGSSWPAEELVKTASELLLWEKLDQEAAAPVLDLSGFREQSLIDAETQTPWKGASDVGKDQEEVKEQDAQWVDGRRWRETRENLIKLGVADDDADKLLLAVPQLLRLDPQGVAASAAKVAKLVGIQGLVAAPKLLSYRVDDIRGGAEYLAIMMGQPIAAVAPLYRKSPELLIKALDGYLQERHTAALLESASRIQSQAAIEAAGQQISAYKSIQDAKKKR